MVTVISISGIKVDYSDKMTFSVSEVAVSMGRQFQEVYLELRGIKYSDEETNEQGENIAANAVVEFSGQIFYVQSSRSFTSEERCDIFASLQEEITKQENIGVERVHLLHAVLHSEPLTLKNLVDRYFSREQLDVAYLKEHNIPVLPLFPRMTREEKKQVEEEVQTFLYLFKHTGTPFTGTAIARIFYGIVSPLFQYKDWSKQKRFWWQYLHMDFNKLCKIATSKLQ